MTHRLIEVADVPAATAILAEDPDTYRLVGGGTALMLMARAEFYEVQSLVSLRQVTDSRLRAVDVGPEVVFVGGQCTLAEIEHHPDVMRELPVLSAALQRLSSVRTRNVATMAGCTAHGDPHMDLPPVLVALHAQIVVWGTKGERRIPCSSFYLGYYEVALEPGDVIVGLEIPRKTLTSWSTYLKFTGALTEDWPVVGIAINLNAPGGVIESAALAVGAVEAAVRRIQPAERALDGRTVDELDPDEVAGAAAADIEPIDDQNGTVWFKRRIVHVHIQRALRDWKDQHGSGRG